jgi:enoyl-CoA hydratase
VTGGVDGLVEERHGHVLVLRIDRPDKANTLTFEIIGGLGAAIERAEEDGDLRVIVLTGTGERTFCAGMDLGAMARATSGEDEVSVPTSYLRLLDGEVSVPVVAAVNGTAMAGGFELLLGCDLVVTSATARFGLPEVKRGLIAGQGTVALASRLPLSIALELGLTGEPIDAGRAYELGLANAVVDPDAVLPTALVLAERIAANAPMAVAATREILRGASVDPVATAERMPALRDAVFGSEDAQEGALAFMEKRPPVWKGR